MHGAYIEFFYGIHSLSMYTPYPKYAKTFSIFKPIVLKLYEIYAIIRPMFSSIAGNVNLLYTNLTKLPFAVVFLWLRK
jgi:hypothetical protein